MEPGERIHNYIVLRKLGGNMGEAWLAGKTEPAAAAHAEVVIKIVRGGVSPEAQGRIASEKRGAQLQKEIAANDKRVVPVNEVIDYNENDLIIEMPHIVGEDLLQKIGVRAMRPDRAARIGLEICEVLEMAYSLKKVVHGDLKPRHVLIDTNGQVRIIDFGIAQRVISPAGAPSPYQAAPYCSPERLRTQLITHQSDLWAVGVILYELLAYKHPFAAPDDKIVERVLDGTGPDPLPSPPEWQHPLEKIIRTMLAFDPAARYPNARTAADELRHFLADYSQDSIAESPQVSEDQDPIPPTATTRPSGKSSPGRVVPVRRLPRSRILIAAAALFALAAAWPAYLFSSQWKSASNLRQGLESNTISLDEAWSRVGANPRGFFIRQTGLDRVLMNRFLKLADVSLHNYRNDIGVVYVNDWTRSVGHLERILAINPAEKEALAKLSICKGHLMRIQSRSIVQGQEVFDQQEVLAAINFFEKARTEMPDLGDSYLGLARIYFTGKLDVERGVEMLTEAAKRGCRPGNREQLMHANALFTRATTSESSSSKCPDPACETRLLNSASADFNGCLEIYPGLVDYANEAKMKMKIARNHLAGIKLRLQEINAGQ